MVTVKISREAMDFEEENREQNWIMNCISRGMLNLVSSIWYLVSEFYGGIAQLGEHLPCKQGVKSSNLFISTKKAETRDKKQETRFKESFEALLESSI